MESDYKVIFFFNGCSGGVKWNLISLLCVVIIV